jgi:hypothetical protein
VTAQVLLVVAGGI